MQKISVVSEQLTPCELCGRMPPEPAALEKHHLVPKSRNGRRTVTVCVDCGDQLHRLFTLRQLRDTYHTMERLRTDERVQRWIGWIRKQRRFGVCMKRKKRR